MCFLSDPANAARYRSDPHRLVVIGHSVGDSWLHEASHDPEMKAVALISAVNLSTIGADPKQREARLKRWGTPLHPVRLMCCKFDDCCLMT